MRRFLFCGSRQWDDRATIDWAVRTLLPARAIVITGGAVGADAMAENAARRLGHHVAVVKPLWDHFGNRAGHIRNAAMLDLRPELVLAFHQDGSPGTAGTIAEAKRRGIPVEVLVPDKVRLTA